MKTGFEKKILIQADLLQFDYAIVGAGASGCIIASRLSESAGVRVLLIEAGPDLPSDREQGDILNPFPAVYGDRRYLWPELMATVGPAREAGVKGFTRRWVQGRVLGGGSSINGMLAMRGAPSDFSEWVELGADGWSWDQILPYYRRLEQDLDFTGPLHGDNGPIPIRRHRQHQWPDFAKAFADAWRSEGLPYMADLHAGHEDSVSPAPMNNLPDRRVGSAQAYLDRSVRCRPNLTILPDTLAERILLEGNMAIGVRVRNSSGVHDLFCRDTVVCAGSIQSPLLLMRSGVGPAAELKQAGISPRIDLAGVGKNLQNHPAFHFAVHLPLKSAQPSALLAPFHSLVRFSSGVPDCPPTDMASFAVAKAAWHPLGERIGAISTFVHKPFSKGFITIVSSDANVMPVVDFKLLSDSRDFERLVGGVIRTLQILASFRVSSSIHEVFIPDGGHANRFNIRSSSNWIKSWIAARIFDIGPLARRLALGSSVVNPALLAKDRDAVERLVLESAACVHHPTGTCQMGEESNPDAVVDSRCRVHGISGLRVADASIMPTIVTAGTHLTALMIGEKASDFIRQDRDAEINSFTVAQ